jgi:hypothetical protein
MVKKSKATLGNALGMIEVRQMTTGFKRFHGLGQNLKGSPFLRFPQDSVLRTPDHMEWLRR